MSFIKSNCEFYFPKIGGGGGRTSQKLKKSAEILNFKKGEVVSLLKNNNLFTSTNSMRLMNSLMNQLMACCRGILT